ncbi:MAG: hypothetical protein FWC56_02605, partial [Phycisphaerae bacterium]|nr:hypothetical protein [Phycisphaerae bacterium]
LPWNQLPAKAQHALLYGTGDAHITFEWRNGSHVWKHGDKFAGIVADLKSKYKQTKAAFVQRYYEKFMRHRTCEACNGARLNPQARAVRVGGKSLHDVGNMSIKHATEFFNSLDLTATEAIIAAEVLKEVRARLEFLVNVGLDYLTLDRTAPTLSGGESQRIRLAGQIGSGLVGVLYVLDEPSIGLHPRDNKQLLASLQKLRDMGNTVVVVEHDEETMRSADQLIDFGPGPGVHGGEVVAAGTVDDLQSAERSLTGAYLSGKRTIEVPQQRRPIDRATKPGNTAVATKTKTKPSNVAVTTKTKNNRSAKSKRNR